MLTSDEYKKKREKQAEDWKSDRILLKKKQDETRFFIEESAKSNFVFINKEKRDSRPPLRFIKTAEEEPGEAE